ncbi:SDR family NAD(P)-dependent oxidoreductase [Dyadobacter frigoris]|uniref:SDR family NAD(P)-dependent oxidoreductase n=1 Tax=Dyadobacter frigoris TaxID=2576211 RepID=A0A4U6DAZ7_9BACT|nr:SDR family NAD(P)-dependent oxidoreductase [Dyadobacter frigoris]TKT93378.1 SDR family NAD(P)-dependent oxidoreductase [Dyadobacter frigoris]
MKKILITGASSGIGLETAKLLAAKNYQLTLVARNEEKLKEAITGLHGKGHHYLVADLNKKEDIERIGVLFEREHFDVLINNAGTGLYGKFTDLPLDGQIGTMFLNMGALVMLSYAYLKNARKGDALVNIGSILAHSSFPGGAVYAGTKSFVANFSESLWYEYKERDIYVMGFNPGAAKSDFHQHAGSSTGSFPEFVLSTTEQVASELVNALEAREKPRVVQGWKNRFMLFGFKFLNRAKAIGVMGKISPGMQ